MSFSPPDRWFEFHRRSQLFLRAHNVTLSVAAMCVCNPDRSPSGINRWDTAPTPTGFAEIVSALGETVACFRAVALWLLVWASGSVWGRVSVLGWPLTVVLGLSTLQECQRRYEMAVQSWIASLSYVGIAPSGYPQVPGDRLRLQSTGFEHGFAGQFPAVTWSGEAEPPSYRLAPDPDIVLLWNIFGIL